MTRSQACWVAACGALIATLLLRGMLQADELPARTLGPGASRDQAGAIFDLAATPVVPGLEVLLRDHLPDLKGKRIGLVCNHTAVDRQGVHAIDRLRAVPDIRLTALFSPEHGIRGRVIAGAIADDTDPATGLPIYSLYGSTRKPTPAMLRDLDLLLVDLQDVGARFYTYSSTLALVMEAAGEAGIPVWVLDRPNPIGGDLMQGPVLDPAFKSFLGYYPIPVRHGCTMGELARLFQGEYQVACDLAVIPMEGWRRSAPWAATGLDWIPPSPSLWSPAATLTYPGVCFFEGTNLSVGGSFFHPYEVVAAPWLASTEIAATCNAAKLPGVHFAEISYTPPKPNDGKYANELCRGVRFEVTDPATFDPVVSALTCLKAIHARHPGELTLRRPHLTLLAGSDQLIDQVFAAPDLAHLAAQWQTACRHFGAIRSPYLLY